MNSKKIIIGVTIGISAAILWSAVFINVLNSMAGIGIVEEIDDSVVVNLRQLNKTVKRSML